MRSYFFNLNIAKVVFYYAAFAMLFCICTNLCHAQHATLGDNDISLAKMKARAHHAKRIGDTYTSLFYYEKIVAKDTSDIAALHQLAELYEVTRNYKKAEEYYGLTFKKEREKYPFALYKRGLMEKRNGKYESAISTFQLFKTQYKNLGDKVFKNSFNRELAGCDSGIVYRDYPSNVLVENSGNSINHPHAEFSPFELDSITMLFGSLRLDTLRFFDVRPESSEVQPTRQLYKAVKQEGKWIENGKFHLLNDSTMDMGNVVYSPLTNKYYFSKCTKDSKGKVNCKIYFIQNKNGNWEQPLELPSPINVAGFTSTQPTIITDTATAALPVIKPRAVTRNSAKSSGKVKPKPTPKIVERPILEYLYFVSDRPGGKGGLDIWYSSFNVKKNQWNPPTNFTAANTIGQELTPYYHHPKERFYFSSDGHVSAGGLDIYQLQKHEGKFTNLTNLSFPINSPQDDLGFMIGTDSAKGFLVSNRPGGTPYFHETCCDDIYSVQLLPPTRYKNLLVLKLIDSTASCGDHKLTIVSYDAIQQKEYHDTLTVKNCEHVMQLKKNYNYSFLAEREGFTQSNLFVENKSRVNFDTLRKQMVLKPMEKLVDRLERLPEPQIDNTVSQLTTPISESERQVVTKTSDVVEGRETTPKPSLPEPTTPALTKIKPVESPAEVPVVGNEKIEEKPTENIPFVLRDIQYATDQAGLSKKAKAALDSLLIPFLKLHSEDKIIISSHTDNKASYSYNMALSKRRADNVVKYLVAQGISRSRLQAMGYGESKPMAPNRNKDGTDNPEGRRLNRRTEFFIANPTVIPRP